MRTSVAWFVVTFVLVASCAAYAQFPKKGEHSTRRQTPSIYVNPANPQPPVINVPQQPAPVVNVPKADPPVINVPKADPPVINIPQQPAPVVNVTASGPDNTMFNWIWTVLGSLAVVGILAGAVSKYRQNGVFDPASRAAVDAAAIRAVESGVPGAYLRSTSSTMKELEPLIRNIALDVLRRRQATNEAAAARELGVRFGQDEPIQKPIDVSPQRDDPGMDALKLVAKLAAEVTAMRRQFDEINRERK
jgi:hypothetical protein